MRAVLLVLIIVVVAIVALLATGLVNINQIRSGTAPQITASRNGVSAKGGQAPAFDVETGSVKVGTTETTVKVPAVIVEKPGRNQSEPVTDNAQ